MTYIPGGGGGGGNISTSGDVALNNPASDEVLTFDASIAKWKNAPSSTATVYPLGCAENPVTDASAARPSGIPVVWWRTSTDPVNAIVGDWVYLPDSNTVTTGSITDYSQSFDSSNGGWTARLNASALSWDSSVNAADPAGGSLRWSATANGNTQVRASSDTFSATAGVTYTASIRVRNGGGVSHDGILLMECYDAAYNDIGTPASAAVSVPSGTGFTVISMTFSAPANVSFIEPSMHISAALLGEQFWVDNVLVTH